MSLEHPLIGISSDLNDGTGEGAHRPGVPMLFLRQHYSDAVAAGGGAPVLLPVLLEEPKLRAMVERLDGLVMSGGLDHDPLLYGEEPHVRLGRLNPRRTAFEIALARVALERGLPILSICGGMQLLNVLAGGTLYQDLDSQREDSIQHAQKAPYEYPTHTIDIRPKTKLSGILRERRIRVNSLHHQAVKKPGTGYIISATSPDGVIEAIEDPKAAFHVGVQWHPEGMWEQATQRALFTALVEAARTDSEKRAKERASAKTAAAAPKAVPAAAKKA